ncbi:MAG: saccharopine dehydrogenase NADP-binding domain-containing protein [Proteobacteria bacterium]|nr:saccharopine dehydrogenase NADP-binding domain-containing protein [Pseudomonadota bacterium]
MKVLCLGGAGKICREAALDLVQFSAFDEIAIGDYDEKTGREAVQWLNDPRVGFKRVDVRDRAAAVGIMEGYDIVMDGTTITLNGLSTACIAEAGCHGINLNGFGEEYRYDPIFKAKGRTHVPGFGMTPGTTDMMAKYAIDRLDTVDTVRISHGAFRPIAFSASITETTSYEYDPRLPGRVVYEDGEFIQVPPFARPLEVELPAPYGTHPQYIIPHAETKTVAAYLEEQGKRARLIEVRGTWPPKNMELIRALYAWGILKNEKIRIAGAEIGIMDAVSAYLMQHPVGQETDLYGYALHIDVTGAKGGKKLRYLLTHTHPPSDGTVAGWEKLRAYTRCVGVPMGIAAEIIARGGVKRTGVVMPEFAFDPEEVFRELEKRRILIHIRVKDAE